ncbi:IclR family transcriptional regulator [Bordetella sputigena]|uniref:IclR family transcriptional regulator n=1 Tax=Bordetella sputigena TaxID=1416810 RepID=UPI0039F04586
MVSKLASPADTGTVNRVLRILAAFAARDRWPLNELARELDLPRASVHRLLKLCRPLGFVDQDAEGLYTPGIELYRVAGKLSAEMPINRLAAPLLQGLRDATDETAMLVLLSRQELGIFMSDIAWPSHPLRYTVPLNQLQPLTWGAAGRSVLAFMEPHEIEQAIAQAATSPLNGRALDVPELRRTLERIRQQGYATSYAERAPDMHGIAVPFFDQGGQVRGNLMVTVPHFRYDEKKQQDHLALLRDAAGELTRRLGWK